MATRRRAREIALQAVYQSDLNPAASAADARRLLTARLRMPALVDFARSLVDGVAARKFELDAILDARSSHWRLVRMAATDRSVLRLALFELLETDTPGPVVVDEAIELARRYGSAESPRFVAGILGSCLADRGLLRGTGVS